MNRLINLLPCFIFAAGTAYLINQGYGAGLIFLGGLATFLTGCAAMEGKDEEKQRDS